MEHLHIVAGKINPESAWVDPIDNLLHSKQKTALRKWVANHDLVETLQVTFAGDKITNAWEPGPREVVARSTYVSLDGSRRDYAGIVCLASTSDAWAGWNVNFNTLVLYRTV